MKILKIIKNKYSVFSTNKKAVFWYTIASIVSNAILFLVTPVYTRILTSYEYGIFSVYQSWQALISIIGVLALDRCITVGFMKFENDRIGFLSSIQFLMTIIIILFIFLVCCFSEFFKILIGLPIYIIISMFCCALLNTSFLNWLWIKRYNYDYKKITIVTIFSTLVIQIIALFSIQYLSFGNRGETLVFSYVFAKLLIYGFIYLSVFFNGKILYEIKYWKFALRYSIAIMPHALAQIILSSSDKIMIDKLCNRIDAAYYSIANSSSMVLMIIIMSISSAIQPWFFENIKLKKFDIIKRKINVCLLIYAGLILLSILTAPEIISVLAPPNYQTAIFAFPPLAVSAFFYGMYLCFANFEAYYEKPIYFSIATGVGAVLNIILNYILIPVFGFIAAGYSTFICYVVLTLLHFIFMIRIFSSRSINTNVIDYSFIVNLSIAILILSLFFLNFYAVVCIRYFILIILFIFCYLKRDILIRYIKK